MKRKFKAASSWMLTTAIILSSFSVIPAREPVTENTTTEAVSETGSERPASLRSKRRVVRISTTDELLTLAQKCVLDKSSRNIRVLLESDIDLTGIDFDGFSCFSGIFEGQGHTISGYFVKGAHTNTGFFRYLTETAIIRNLNIEGSLSCEESGVCIGGLAGKNSGLISNCCFSGSVSAQENTGGLVGYNTEEGVIVNSAFYGKVLGPHMTGGIAGLNEGNIFSCANAGKINNEPVSVSDSLTTDLSGILLGGGIGSIDPGTIDISSIGNEDFVEIINIGGIAGQSTGVIDNCVNEGTVGYPHTGYNVGGIAGITSGLLSSCRNDGAIYGRKDTGGIAGQIEPQTIWEYSSDQLDELLSQLEDLNGLLAGMVSDASLGVGAAHDHITAVETALGQTITDLRGVIGETVGDLYVQGDLIRSLMELLGQSINKEDLDGISASLAGLYTVLTETDFFSTPLKVKLDGNVGADLNGDVNTTSTITNDLIFSIYQALALQLAGTRETTDPGTIDTIPAGNEEIPAVNDGAPGDDYYDFAEADDSYENQGDDNSYDFQEEGDDSYDYQEADDSYNYQENDDSSDYQEDDDTFDFQRDSDSYDYQAAAADEDNNDTDYENDDAGSADDMTDVPAGASEEGSVPRDEDAGSNSSYSSAAATIIEDLQEEVKFLLEHGIDISIGGNAGADIDGDLDVSLDMDLPTADDLTGLIEDLLAHCGNLLDTETLELAKGVLQEIALPAPDTTAFTASFNNLMEAMKPLDDDIASIASNASQDFTAVTEQMNTICRTFFDYIEDLSALNNRSTEDDSIPDAWSNDTGAVSLCLNCGNVSADTNVGGVVGSVSYEDMFDAEDLVDVSSYIFKDAKKIIFASVRRCENRGKVNAKKANAGGIAGSLSNGIITGCSSAGEISVDEEGFCGGIAGDARSAITESLAKNLVISNSYTGGIAGKGDTILSCITYSEVRSDGPYKGSVAGLADGDVSNNLYIDRGLGGIDGVSFTGKTDPFTEEEAISLATQAVEAAQDTSGSTAEAASSETASTPAPVSGTEAETASEVTSETASEAASEIASEIASEGTSETETEAASEIASEAASETASEIASEAASEISTEVASETETEAASEGTSETETEAASETAFAPDLDEGSDEEEFDDDEFDEEELAKELARERDAELNALYSDTYGVPDDVTYGIPVNEVYQEENNADNEEFEADKDFEEDEEFEEDKDNATEPETVGKTAAEKAIEQARQENEEKETENGSVSSNPLASNDPVVTFIKDDEVFSEVVVPFGKGITDLPKVPNDGDDYWVWDDFDQDEIYSSLMVNGSYYHPVTTLASEDNPPSVLVEGVFYDGMDLNVSQAELPQTGEDGEAENAEPLKTYTVSVSNYNEPLTVRAKEEAGGTLYQVGDDYALTELPYVADGSYLVFELPNNGTFTYEALSELEKKFPLAAKLGISGCIAAAVVLLLLLIHIHRKRKRRKASV